MKTLRLTILLIFCVSILLSSSSCVVVVKETKPQHLGWYKNPHNPHHPNSTNPGKSKGNHWAKKH